MRQSRWAAALVGSTMLVGCFNAGIQPRTGDLVRAGSITAGGTMTVAGFAPGSYDLKSGGESSGNSAQTAQFHILMEMFAYFIQNAQGFIRWAPIDGLELGGSVGVQQQSIDIRGALLDEDTGAPFSVALSATAAWRPIYDVASDWYSLGFDVSRRFGSVAPLLDVYVSYGDERHAVALDADDSGGCNGFGDPGCGEYSAGSILVARRDELRLRFAVGAAFEVEDDAWMTVAVVPYWTAWAGEPHELICENCAAGIVPTRFVEEWGIYLTLGGSYAELVP